MAMTRQHLIGSLGTPRSSGVIRELVLDCRPMRQDRLNHGPACFYHVLSCIYCGIANDGVEQQGFVSRWGALAEARSVIEVHRYRTKSHPGAGAFGDKLQRDAFFRLDSRYGKIGRGGGAVAAR